MSIKKQVFHAESFPSCLWPGLFSAKGANAIIVCVIGIYTGNFCIKVAFINDIHTGSTCSGVIFTEDTYAKGTCIKSTSIETAYAGISYTWGVYVRNTCIKGYSDNVTSIEGISV